jgi:hypothetical protein
MIIKYSGERIPLPRRKVFGGGQQQPPVHPDRIGDPAAPTEQVAGGALPDLGDHLVRQRN